MRWLISALVVAVVPCATSAQEPPAGVTGPRAALWREIRAVNDSMEAAFNRGDMRAVAAFYADDSKLAGGGDVVEGRAAVDAYWGRLGGRGGTWRLEVFEVGGSRDLAYQRGRSHLTLRSADGRERTSVVDFVVVWRRNAEGGLRIWLDLY
jgi:ketosteroid isomerase-like protein